MSMAVPTGVLKRALTKPAVSEQQLKRKNENGAMVTGQGTISRKTLNQGENSQKAHGGGDVKSGCECTTITSRLEEFSHTSWPLTESESDDSLDIRWNASNSVQMDLAITDEFENASSSYYWHRPWENLIKHEVLPFKPVLVPGLQVMFHQQHVSPIDAFRLFFDIDIVTDICKSMEAYADMRKQKGKVEEDFELPSDFGPECFYRFIGLLIFMGLFKCPSLKEYFCSDRFDFPFVSKVPLSAQEFKTILHCLHFTMPKDDSDMESEQYNGRLSKIQQLIEHFGNCCREFVAPDKELCILERTTNCQEEILNSKQQCQTKVVKWGFKLWTLTCPKTGYIHNFEVFCGTKKDALQLRKELPQRIVSSLLRANLNYGHVVYMGSHLVSPALFEELIQQKTYCVGGIRNNSEYFPQGRLGALNSSASLGDIKWCKHGNVFYIQWMESNLMTVASTYHSGGSVCTNNINILDKESKQMHRAQVQMPEAIADYRKNMRCLYPLHQVCGNEVVLRNTIRWYAKVFLHCIDIAVTNSFVIFDHFQKTTEKPRMSHVEYRKKLIQQLCFSPSDILIPPVIP